MTIPADGLPVIAPPPGAAWMWASEGGGANVWACFRSGLRLEAAPATAPAVIAVDSKYWLWVNGVLVVREGGLKRGPTPEDGYADRLDLAPWLRVGSNTIAILAWHFGADGASHRNSGRAGLLVAIEAGAARLASGPGWRARRHPAFGPGGEGPTVTLAEHGLDVDAARLDAWSDPVYDDAAWAPAVVCGLPPEAPWGGLVARPIPFWHDGEPVSAPGLPVRGPLRFRARLPCNQQAYPWVEVEAAAGSVVRFGLDRGRTTVRLICAAGLTRFESPAWLNGSELWVEVPEGAVLRAAGWRPTGYAAELVGSFACSEPDLESLWRKSAITLRLCMRDTWMDCPDRERSAWIGDVANMVEFAHQCLDPRADALTAKSFRELVAWRTADGELWSAVPTGRFRGGFRAFPAQTLAALATALGDHWLATGDRQLLEDVYPAVRHYLLAMHRLGADGLVEHRGPWGETRWEAGLQAWYDWGSAQDQALMDQGWYAWALLTLAMVAGALGRDADAAACLARHAAIAAAVQGWWDDGEGGYRAPGLAHPADDRGNALVVLAGLVPDRHHARLADLFGRRREASIYMEPRVVDALFALGRGDLALARTRLRFAAELASPSSTLPEHFGEDSNHAWGAAIAGVLVRRLSGMSPREPGWRVAACQPSWHGPRTVAVSIPSPLGSYAVTIHRDAVWRVDLEVPAGGMVELRLPGQLGRPQVAGLPGHPGDRFAPGSWRITATAG